MLRSLVALTSLLLPCAACVLDSRSLGAYVTPRPHHGSVDTAKEPGLSHTSIAGRTDSFEVARLGDLDGDGCEDFAVLRQDQSSDAEATARVDVIYGREDLFPPHVDLAQITQASFTVPFVRASVEVFPLGDWDDDGLDDAAVAVAGERSDDGISRARVHILWGAEGRLRGTTSLDALPLAAASEAESVDDVSPMPLRGVGDVDGDRVVDVVLRLSDDDGATLLRWSGGASARELPLRIDTARTRLRSAEPSAVIEGAIGLGDLDGDGFDDLAVRTVAPDGGAAADTWLLFGAATMPDELEIAAVGLRILDPIDTAMPVAGDFDGDGARDLVVPRFDPETATTPTVILRGPIDRAQSSVDLASSTTVTRSCLEHVQAIGDIDGDGRDDLVAVDCELAPAAISAVFHGWDAKAATLERHDAAASFIAVAGAHPHGVALGDVDADGVDDWALVEDPFCVGCAEPMRFHLVWGASASDR